MLGYSTIVKSTIHSCDRSYIEPIIGIFNIVSTAVDKLDMLNIKKIFKIRDILEMRFTY